MSNKKTYLFLITCAVLGIALTFYGLTFGFLNFMPNVIAGWSQFFIQIIIGLVFLDKAVEGIKSRQWDKVKQIHYRILNEHIIKILSEIALRLKYVDIAKSLLYKKRTNKDVSLITESLVKELNFIDSQDTEEHKEIFISYYEDMKEEIKEIRVIFIPQIIGNVNNEEIANLLSELDLLLIKFEDDIIRCKTKEHANFNMVNFIRLVECASDVYGKLIL